MAATTPSFSSTARIATGSVTTANANYDGTGSVITIATGATTGSRIERIRAESQGTSLAGIVRFFLFNDSGTFVHMIDELSVQAISASATVKCWQGNLQYGNLNFFVLPSNYTIRASTSQTNTFTIAIHITE
jgi:hypothetical protein